VKRQRKRRRLIIDFLTVVIVVLSIIGVYLGLRIVLGTTTPWVAVASGSMSPALQVGDLIIVQGVPATSIQVGEIIIFDSPQESPTIHRVTRIQTLPNGTIEFKTKGDANPAEDDYWVTSKNIHGRVLYRIPYLGWLALEPTIPIIIIIIAVIVVYVWPEDHRKQKKHKLTKMWQRH
jgi:signal peptidase